MKRILVVEDGTEYVEAFRRLAPVRDGRVELVGAGDLLEARRALEGAGAGADAFDAVFLDVVFDRTPPERLCGDTPALRSRFADDASGVREHLARQQGFYLADALAGSLPPGVPVVIACDFTGEPGRLEALRDKIPGLEGIDDDAPLSHVLGRLIGSTA